MKDIKEEVELTGMKKILIKNDYLAVINYESDTNNCASYYAVVYKGDCDGFNPVDEYGYDNGNFIYYHKENVVEKHEALVMVLKFLDAAINNLHMENTRVREIAIGFCDALVANTTYEETFDYAKNDLYMTDDELQIFGLEVVG